MRAAIGQAVRATIEAVPTMAATPALSGFAALLERERDWIACMAGKSRNVRPLALATSQPRVTDELRDAVAAAKQALQHRFQSVYPELQLGRARPGDVTDICLREHLELLGFRPAEVEKARSASPVLSELLRERSASAASNVRKRARDRRHQQ